MCEATPALYSTWLNGVDKDYFIHLPEDFLQVLRFKGKAFFFSVNVLLPLGVPVFSASVRNICYSDEYLTSYMRDGSANTS